MTREKCTHESIYVDNVEEDMTCICEKCGEHIYISHIKNGLYAINYDEKIYLLNTINDMDLNNNPYQFEINGNNVCIHGNTNGNYKTGSARQLCKRMKK